MTPKFAIQAFLAAVFLNCIWKCCENYPEVMTRMQIFELKPGPQYDGPLTKNNILNGAEKLFENVVRGPESFVVRDGYLYTGLEDGRIIRIKNDEIETITIIGGSNCVPDIDFWESVGGQKVCGRPLGLRFDAAGDLVVADSFLGIYKVNITTGEMDTIVSSTHPSSSFNPNFADDLVITKEGNIFFTDATLRWEWKHMGFDLVEHLPQGRLILYNATTRIGKVVLHSLYFANGLELSPDEDYLLISQHTEANILKLHLTGPDKGKVEKFAQNLPGFPDNIRSTGRGTYYVAIPVPRVPGSTTLVEIFGPYPRIRKLLMIILVFTGRVLHFLYKLSSISLFETLRDALFDFLEWTVVGSPYGLVLEMDNEGNILRSLHSPKGRVHRITQLIEHEGFMYLGSYTNNFIGRVRIDPTTPIGA